MKQRQTEMWANNKTPYFASYAPNGVAIYPQKDVGHAVVLLALFPYHATCFHAVPALEEEGLRHHASDL